MIDWKRGDELRHGGRPEWGVGTIERVEASVVEGRACQRLAVRFDRIGLKTLSTAFAQLERADAEPQTSGGGWLGAAERTDPAEALLLIPEAARDPFRGPVGRLEASVALYRFTGEGGSLLDWAAAQTGIRDPLSRFSRQELEEQFGRFRRALDEHLIGVAREASRSDPAGVRRVVAKAPDGARAVLRRLNIAC